MIVTTIKLLSGYITDTDTAGTALTSADTFHEMWPRLEMVSTDYALANIDAAMEII